MATFVSTDKSSPAALAGESKQAKDAAGASEAAFTHHLGLDAACTVASARISVGTVDEINPAMGAKLSFVNVDPELKFPTLTVALLVDDALDDFKLGSVIGSLQTLLDGATAAFPARVSVCIDPPAQTMAGKAILVKVRMVEPFRLGPENRGDNPDADEFRLNMADVVDTAEAWILSGMSFDQLLGDESTTNIVDTMAAQIGL